MARRTATRSRPSPHSRTDATLGIPEKVQPVVPFVGLTGGMGSGKSTALEALRRLGAEVISSDAVVHELYESQPLRDAVVAHFGPEVAPGGVVDRSALARRAFVSAQERAWLEGQVWPLVGARVAQWLEQARAGRPAPSAAVVEVPLLFEAGLERLYDATIAVVAEESVRERRAAQRGHALVDERAARQLSQQEKARRATFVVRNDGSEAELERKLSAVLGKLGG
jgi:dephospho-CoA kinase